MWGSAASWDRLTNPRWGLAHLRDPLQLGQSVAVVTCIGAWHAGAPVAHGVEKGRADEALKVEMLADCSLLLREPVVLNWEAGEASLRVVVLDIFGRVAHGVVNGRADYALELDVLADGPLLLRESVFLNWEADEEALQVVLAVHGRARVSAFLRRVLLRGI